MPTPSTGDAELLQQFDPTVVASGFHPFAMIEPVFALNRIYFFFEDGLEPWQVYDGSTLKEASGIAPSALPTVNAVAPAGAGDTGQRWYTITYYDPTADVETGPAADEDSVSADLYTGIALVAQDADVVISNPPASHSRFTKARVYRNLKPLTDMYLLGDITITPGAGGTVTFTDSFTVDDDELATSKRLDLRTRFYSEGLPPASYTAMFFEGHLYGVYPNERNHGWVSEANKPENVPTGSDNEFWVLPSEQDPNPEIVALRPNNGQRYIYTRRGIYHLAGSPGSFEVRCVVAGVGPDSTYSTKYIEGVGVTFLAQDKPYVHLGAGDVRPMGIQKVLPNRNPLGDLYTETDAGRRKHSDALVYPERNDILLAMAENGAAVNERIFVWNYSENHWSVWRRAIMRMGMFALPNGKWLPVFADELGCVNQMDVGDSEGVYSGVLLKAITASARSSVSYSVTGGTVHVSKGNPILILDADSGVLYRNRVVSELGGLIAVLHPWETLPTTAQFIEPGSIEWVWESGWFTLFSDRAQAVIANLAAQLVKQEGGTMRALLAADMDSSNWLLIDDAIPLTVVEWQRAILNARGNVIKVRLENTAPGSPVGLVAFDLDVTKKSHRVGHA